MSTISQILVFSPDVVIGKGRHHLSAFEKNQVIHAEVIKVVSPRQAQLYIQGKKVWAETHAVLKEGEKVKLRAEPSGGQQVFKLVRQDEEIKPHVDHHRLQSLGRSGPYGELENLANVFSRLKESLSIEHFDLIDRFSQLLKDISLKSSTPDVHLIRNMIKHSGLTWEFNLASGLTSNSFSSKDGKTVSVEADLKALSLKLSQLLPDTESEAGRIIRNFITNLEQLQLFNHLAHEESGKYLLYLPVLLDQRFKFGQMLIDFGHGSKDKKEAKDRMVKVSLILGMSNLGDILADFSVFKKSISGHFSVGNDMVSSFIQNNLSELEDKLRSRGFEVHQIGCRVIAPEKLANTSFIEKMADLSKEAFHLVI